MTARILLTFLCLLTLTTSAHAECAWVLWEERSFALGMGGQLSSSKDWIIDGVHDDRASCRTKLQLLGDGFQKTRIDETDEKGYTKRQGPLQDGKVGYFFSITKSDTFARAETHTFSCLPDTVDPRGPKGK